MTEPINTIQIWQHFQELVLTMQQTFSAELELAPLPARPQYAAINTYFQQQIMTTADDPWPAAITGKMRSYITEIHRLLKLIQRDMVFWQSARQPVTQAQRQSEILSKLNMILQFCRSMIEELHTSVSPVGYPEK